MKRHRWLLLVVSAVGAMTACREQAAIEPGADAHGHTAPTAATIAANAAVLEALDFGDRQDFEDASRGLIASDPGLKVTAETGEVVWNPSAYDFIQGDAPGSVNPSLWRQAQLNKLHGLFEVTEGIYQLRGYDLSNMTFIEGETGWIVVDPLTARETAAAAVAFAQKHLPAKPIVAMIFTHSHIDHFGGALGVLAAQDTTADTIRIIVPQGFMQEATGENIIAGPAMSRRAMFMFGKRLARSERGHVDSGIGKSPAFGSSGLLAPTDVIDRTPQSLLIDGIEFIFQNTPGSEAPAELTFYLPHVKAFNGAEITSHQMHNVYTLRGAKVRDALRWSNYIDESIELFGDAEIYLAGHHWPIWGNGRILAFLRDQRDLYKYLHDQTVRLFNQGLTPGEIAEEIELPESLRSAFHNRGYYGTARHNARAVYQNYLGWYDGNPANLNPLPPAEAGRRYVALMGGPEIVLAEAGEAFDRGDYRWVAQLLNHLIFADPDHGPARVLLAAAYDQLGYQSESAPWRDVYLSAAYELRHGPPEEGLNVAAMEDLLRQTPVERLFDSLAVRLDGPGVAGEERSVVIEFSDRNRSYLLKIANGVLRHGPAREDGEADARLRLTHDLFVAMLIGKAGLRETLFSDDLEIEGSALELVEFFSRFDKPEGKFNIVTP